MRRKRFRGVWRVRAGGAVRDRTGGAARIRGPDLPILELEVDYDQFRVIWSSIFTEILIPESMLEGLGRRYRLVLVSNTNALHFEMIRETYATCCATSTTWCCPTKCAP